MNKCNICGSETENPKYCNKICKNASLRKRRQEVTKLEKCKYCKGKMNSGLEFCSRKCSAIFKWRKRVEAWLKQGHLNGVVAHMLRKFCLYYFDHKCSICNIEEWMEVPTPLIVDHINGDPYDNSISNLRLICPNCDAQLPTYKSKNKGNGRRLRRLRYKKEKEQEKQFPKCKDCGRGISKGSERCIKCNNLYTHNKLGTKINYPPIKELRDRITASSINAVAKEIGCSFNTLKKHLKKYSPMVK